ncbi:MAG TPA: hypothetical protein VF122_00995 [Caulobacteraceae bacterium]
MPRVSLAFFTVGALCGITGMMWGMHMAASQDITMMPAHAHLNLLGWVTLSLMGTFYALAGDRVSNLLAWANFVLSTAGVLIAIPMLAQVLGGNEALGPSMIYPEVLLVAGMAAFILSILNVWRKPKAA